MKKICTSSHTITFMHTLLVQGEERNDSKYLCAQPYKNVVLYNNDCGGLGGHIHAATIHAHSC